MTEKKIRKAIRRVWFHWYRLQNALNDAHIQEVIVYPQDKGEPPVPTCCDASWEVRERFEKWTSKKLAETIHQVERAKA